MPAIPPPEHERSQEPLTLPIRKHKFDTPKLRLQLNDLAHEGSSQFLSNIKGNEDLEEQVQNVLNLLYTPDSHIPGTRSVTFIIRDAGGVAYTTGIDLDNDHKEIHINLDYIKNKPRYELLGVINHELVHCFQWDAEGTCDGGLIEGIADWVRLRSGLAAKHWKQDAKGKWNAGYQHTGYFLDYLQHRFGPGTVQSINACLRKGKYDEEKIFNSCTGHKVEELWKDYAEDLEKKKPEDEDSAKRVVDPEKKQKREDEEVANGGEGLEKKQKHEDEEVAKGVEHSKSEQKQKHEDEEAAKGAEKEKNEHQG